MDEIDQMVAQMRAVLRDGRRIKLAMLVMRSFGGNDMPCNDRIDAAIQRLIASEDIQSWGDVTNWRGSEICLSV